MELESPVKLKPEHKRRRLSINAGRCLICGGGGKLVNPKVNGKKTFIKAFQQRGSCPGLNISELSNVIDFDHGCFTAEVSDSIRRHKHCYASFTSTRNITASSVHTDAPSTSTTNPDSCFRTHRSKRNTNIEWEKVCLFCEQTKYRGETELRRVEYEKFWKTLEIKCKEKGDTDLQLKIGCDFSVLPALEARYHNKCHVAYIKSNYKRVTDGNVYDAVFQTFVAHVTPLLTSGRALEMTSLTQNSFSMLL